MSLKKSMGIIVLVGLTVLLIFVFFLYSSIKTKSTGLDQYSPFKEWIGEMVTMDKETVLITEKVRQYDDKEYPYLLLDSLHPEWPYLDERIKLGDYILVEKFPVGTKLHIEKAVQFTGGVSGYSTPFVFGAVSYNSKNYKVGYQWGTMDTAKFMDKVKACSQFHQAPWQSQADTAYYGLPDAKFL